MALDTYVVLANQYDSEWDALADYDAGPRSDSGLARTFSENALARLRILLVHADLGHPDECDASQRVDVEEPTRHGGAMGLVVGLAVGALAALFPAISLGAGLLAGSAIGASAGAIAGHVVGGMRRSDLKDLGELLDKGTSGLLVVAATDVESRVNAAITRAKKRAKAQVQVDADALKAEIDRGARSAGQGR
jgi:hypothetical protein